MQVERISLRNISMRDISMRGISMQGKGTDSPLYFEGYPLAVDLPNARRTQSYTLFGNTSGDAKGVGDEVVQNFPSIPTTTRLGITFTNNGDGSYLVNGTNTSTEAALSTGSINYDVKAGHKYLTLSNSDKVLVNWYGTGVVGGISGRANIRTASADATIVQRLRVAGGVSVDNETVYPQSIDLTAIYGSGNEPATADDFAHRLGYADAEHLPAFPYGSSFVAPIRVGSRNLWDEEWEKGNFNAQGQETADNNTFRSVNYIKIDAQRAYYLCSTRAVLFLWYDKDKNYISSNGVSANRIIAPVPSNCVYVRIRVNTPTYGNDICINLSDEHNGEYSPYFAPTLYPSVLSSPLHKIGDIVDYKESNGKEHHAFGTVKLKDLAWSKTGDIEFNAQYSRMKYGINFLAMACAEYPTTTQGTGSSKVADKQIGAASNYPIIIIKDSAYETAAEFKAHFTDEDILVFALAEPTEVQGEPLPRLAIPKGESIVTLDTAVEPSNITAKV